MPAGALVLVTTVNCGATSRSMRNKWEIEEYRVTLGKLDTLQDVLFRGVPSQGSGITSAPCSQNRT
jgi:hypothetical protein